MNLNFKKVFIFLSLSVVALPGNAEEFYSSIIREKALANGYAPPQTTYQPTDNGLVEIGRQLFESKNLSLNGNIACVTCHIDSKGSSDGIPNSAGIGGAGKGMERYLSGGRVVPRNSLSLFGVGGKGFETFFWDGRVQNTEGRIVSQFGESAPSSDPLVVAVHLPVVEIRETLIEDAFISAYKKETIHGAGVVYQAVLDNLKDTEPAMIDALAKTVEKSTEQLEFLDVASALANFIREKFKIRESSFSSFMNGQSSLEKEELLGGIVFYGKGGCSACHSGPYFSNFQFHTIALPQAGFGKNGFGVDYGRYNTTFNPEDLYKFRTPILHNVTKTFPYGHSGSLYSLKEVVQAHYDPLMFFDIKTKNASERHEYLKYLKRNDSSEVVGNLTDNELEQIIAFLKTLEFKISN
ncbi:His-Xaa-Ser system-associated MauG-like protein [Alphaproteobacteria bacterium]|nr:His-Xaa-Ser system-associated MauG-like protein [Alphaproteobacteria bacterium]